MDEAGAQMPLLEWLKTNTDFTSLDELSLASGVDLPSLQKFNAGEALPSIHHVKSLRRVFPKMPLDVLKTHTVTSPEHISTRRGTLPEGTELHTGKVRDLMVGDYIPYVLPKGHESIFGSHWVQVRSTIKQNILHRLDLGGIERPFHSDVSIRFARKAN
jgi:hypothetical protein